MASTVHQLEQLNRQLKQELNKMIQPRANDDGSSTVMWRHRVELLLTHNKVSLLLHFTLLPCLKLNRLLIN